MNLRMNDSEEYTPVNFVVALLSIIRFLIFKPEQYKDINQVQYACAYDSLFISSNKIIMNGTI